MSHEKNTRRAPPCLQITESVDVKKSTTSESVTFGSKGDSSLMDGSIKSRYCHAVFLYCHAIQIQITLLILHKMGLQNQLTVF